MGDTTPLEPIPATSFRSRDYGRAEQFEAWRDRISVVFDVAPLGDRAGGFAAEAHAYHLGELIVVRTPFDGQRFLRTPRQVRTDLIDHYLVQLYLRGGYVGEVDGDGIRIEPGSVSVLDMGCPLETRATPAEVVSLVVPRDVMHSVLPAPVDLHGLVVRGAAGALLADYVASLERRLPELEQAQAPYIVRATCDLVAACIVPSAETRERAREQIDALQMQRVTDLIDRNLCSPDLSPGSICAALGISRTRLYDLMKPRGGVHKYIQTRRLIRVHALLADPAERRPIMEIAACYGFTSHAHLTRAFRRHFGYNPSDVRFEGAARLRARAPSRVRIAAGEGPSFDDWIRALRG
ncbi:MAG TPA: helix-turn-helix domain-containing protein [Gammaproteobacteria bacterium]